MRGTLCRLKNKDKDRRTMDQRVSDNVQDSHTTGAEKAQTIYRKDYTPPDFGIEHVDLTFDLCEGVTHVTARLDVVRQAAAGAPLVLDGDKEVHLQAVLLDGVALTPDQYDLTDDRLIIANVPDKFTLDIHNDIHPAANTALEGLYVSNGMYCTQCEAEGFRRITYFPDRPDVMARYRVTIQADRDLYPVLLSNGNQVDEGDMEDGRHFAVWEDPFPKPSYLFALVAGDLVSLDDSYTTASGRDVRLRLFVEPADLDKCGHAMDSLKKSMRWDEQVYGLEYDLDIFNIVAVSHFNMGAMENKSLNIFNTKCVLAKPETATDNDFAAVEAVVAHEYFHNWTGNRVTCRDWFQLSLKEGLTVFRDQEFSADMGSRALKRIEDVRLLRQHQFAEDSGPMAHPVRPDSYIEINNFYTVTIYEKGAEVIRMIHNLLGAENYRKGMDLYFQRHDGQAVTCDDFVQAMEDASGVDLSQFRLWYGQAGTPQVSVKGQYDADKAVYHLTLSQQLDPTPGQTDKKPMQIPVKLGLLDRAGADMPLQLEGEDTPQDKDGSRVLSLTSPEQTFSFVNVPERPVPSILRGFSAPVSLSSDLGREELLFLMAHDADSFNRWEAGQVLARQLIMALVDDLQQGRELVLAAEYVAAVESCLSDPDLDKALFAEMLALPTVSYLGQFMDIVDVDGLHTARQFVRQQLARQLKPLFEALYTENRSAGAYYFTPDDVGRRRLKNTALGYLMENADDQVTGWCHDQLATANNMTDEQAALMALVGSARPEKEQALQAFYDKWHQDALVLDKWFSVQAVSPQPDTLDRVIALTEHADFDLRTPNRVRALIAAFCGQNMVRFHEASGRGYQFLGDQVLALDALNPQIASRLVQPLTRWRKFDVARQNLMRAVLQRVMDSAGLSKDVYEVVSKSLADV